MNRCPECGNSVTSHQLQCPRARVYLSPDYVEDVAPHVEAHFEKGFLVLDLRVQWLEKTKRELKHLLGGAYLPSDGA